MDKFAAAKIGEYRLQLPACLSASVCEYTGVIAKPASTVFNMKYASLLLLCVCNIMGALALDLVHYFLATANSTNVEVFSCTNLLQTEHHGRPC